MTSSYLAVAAPAAASLPLAAIPDPASAIAGAAGRLLPHLERGQRIDAGILRAAMEAAFGASDATGAWDWKSAYEACEAATVLFLRKFGPAMQARAATPAAMLAMLTKVAGLLPTHTRRSEESQALQQFSTPIPLGFCAAAAAAITPADLVLEPSAGTGLLAILAELAGGALALNELADTRSGLLARLFPGIPVSRFDAAQIDDHLDADIRPSVVLMNPPFSAHRPCRSPHGGRRVPPYPLGARAPCRWRASRRHHGRELCAGRSRLDRCFHRASGAWDGRLHGPDRRRGLCPAWHGDRDASHRHRQTSGRRSGRVSALAQYRAWCRAGCRHAARLGDGRRSAAVAGHLRKRLGRNSGQHNRPQHGRPAARGTEASFRLDAAFSGPKPCRRNRRHRTRL